MTDASTLQSAEDPLDSVAPSWTCQWPTTKEEIEDQLEDIKNTKYLNFMDRINIASCAAKRASDNCTRQSRFYGEYTTARAWIKYRCYITKHVKYIES
ncbi:hypothetical protein EBT31_19150 [bacterium]|nr:hypothetical protein [bacterium]